MKKSTLLKKTKNELTDMLISLNDEHQSLKEDYRTTCDELACYRTENEQYIDVLSHTERSIIILFVVCVVSLIANIIQLFV